MSRGDFGLPKVPQGPAMPDPSMPYRQATPETAIWPFQGRPASRVGSLRPSSTLLDTPRRMPMEAGREAFCTIHCVPDQSKMKNIFRMLTTF
jgi:hypothetical protein